MVDIRCLDGRLPIGRYVPGVGGEPTSRGRENERARRREARELVAAYHDEQLRALLERVSDGFARLDAGEIDAFDLDDLIHHYTRCGTRAVEVLRIERIGMGARGARARVLARAGRGAGMVGSRRSTPPTQQRLTWQERNARACPPGVPCPSKSRA